MAHPTAPYPVTWSDLEGYFTYCKPFNVQLLVQLRSTSLYCRLRTICLRQ